MRDSPTTRRPPMIPPPPKGKGKNPPDKDTESPNISQKKTWRGLFVINESRKPPVVLVVPSTRRKWRKIWFSPLVLDK